MSTDHVWSDKAWKELTDVSVSLHHEAIRLDHLIGQGGGSFGQVEVLELAFRVEALAKRLSAAAALRSDS